jgi:steroid delta-isomerase-like uncharacterized protein
MDPAASVRRFYEMINSGDLEQFFGLLAEDFVEHEETPVPGSGREAVKQLFAMMQSGFPNMRWEPQEVLVDGDRAVARVRFNATNDGEFMGMPATGKNVSIQVIDIIRFSEDGLAREHWGLLDMMGLMQQLGAVPDAPA